MNAQSPEPTREQPRLFFVYSGNWPQRHTSVLDGASPAEAHAYYALAQRGVDVEAFGATRWSGLAWRVPSEFYQRAYVIPRTALGYRVHVAHAVRRRVPADDWWILGTADSLALPLLSLKRRRRLANPIVYFSIGLADRVSRGLVRPKFVRRYADLAAAASVVLVFDPCEAELLRTWIEPERVHVMPYGVDVGWWEPPPSIRAAGRRVLSVGRDSARDFPTLAAAVAGLDAETTIFSRIARSQGVEETPFLRIRDASSMVELRAAIWASDVVALPIKNVDQPSGQSSAIQAMAAAKPVILSDTGWARESGLRAGEHFVDVRPEDAEALHSALEDVLRDPVRSAAMGRRAQAAVRERLSTDAQADVILSAIVRAGR